MINKIESKLAYQLLIKIMSVISIVIFLVGISVVIFMRLSSERELESQLNIDSIHVQNEITALFESAETHALQLSLNETIFRYLDQVSSQEDIEIDPHYEEVLNILNSINDSGQDNLVAWVASVKGNFYLSGDGGTPGPEYEITQRPWFKPEFFDQSHYYSDPYYDWGTDAVVVSAIKPIRLNNGDQGFVAIDFDLDIIPEVIDKINVGEEGKILIMDQSNQIIYHPLKQLILGSKIEDVMPDLQGDLTYTTGNSIRTLNLDGDAYYLKSVKIDRADWKLLMLVKVSDVTRPLKAFLWDFILGLLLLALLVMVIIGWFIQKLLKPIDGLTAYGGQVAKGNLYETPPYEYAKRPDEMGDLARSFVTITEVFKQKNKMLEERVHDQQLEIQKQYHYILEKEKMASIGTLVAGVAHEINTPLGVSITTGTYIEEIAQEISKAHDNKKLSKSFFQKQLRNLEEASDLLVSNLNRAEGLVVQFKNITSQESNLDYDTIDLKIFVDQVIKDLKPALLEKAVEVKNDIRPGIEIISLSRALSQVFINLIMNSLHHGFSDNQDGQIHLQGSLEDGRVEVVYRDSGKGMSKETLDHLFEPFYTTKRNGKNSGLGMFIIHNLVHKNLRGNLTCESQVNQGVTFKIGLPQSLVEK